MLHQTSLQAAPDPSPDRDDFGFGCGMGHAALLSLALWGSVAAVCVAASTGHPWLAVMAGMPATITILAVLGYAADLPSRMKSLLLRHAENLDATMAEYDHGGDRYMVCRRGERRPKPMTPEEFDTLRAEVAADGGVLTLIYADRGRGEITLTRHCGGLLHGTEPECPAIARLSRAGDRRWYFDHGKLLQGPDYLRGPPLQRAETTG